MRHLSLLERTRSIRCKYDADILPNFLKRVYKRNKISHRLPNPQSYAIAFTRQNEIEKSRKLYAKRMKLLQWHSQKNVIFIDETHFSIINTLKPQKCWQPMNMTFMTPRPAKTVKT